MALLVIAKVLSHFYKLLHPPPSPIFLLLLLLLVQRKYLSMNVHSDLPLMTKFYEWEKLNVRIFSIFPLQNKHFMLIQQLDFITNNNVVGLFEVMTSKLFPAKRPSTIKSGYPRKMSIFCQYFLTFSSTHFAYAFSISAGQNSFRCVEWTNLSDLSMALVGSKSSTITSRHSPKCQKLKRNCPV